MVTWLDRYWWLYSTVLGDHGGVCRNRANVLVFVSFLVVQVFLLHNILLASVSELA